MTLTKSFTDLADDAMELIGPALSNLLKCASNLDRAKIVGATITLTAQDSQGQKYVQAAVTGCTCIGCLEAAVRAINDAYGISHKELGTEASAQDFGPIKAVH